MRLKCLKNKLEKEEMIKIGNTVPDFFSTIMPGKEYTVLGLSFVNHSNYMNGAIARIKFCNMIYDIPLCLFEIIDTRPSKFWQAQFGNGCLFLWPKEFYRDFFDEDLSNDVPEVLEIFKKVVYMMEREFDEDYFVREIDNRSYPEHEWWKDPKMWQD